MPAEPPRDTIHVTQHLILDGFRILRAQLPPEVMDEALLVRLEAAIALLEPMTGMPIRDPGPRLFGLAHGLEVLVTDLIPYINAHTLRCARVPRPPRRDRGAPRSVARCRL